MDIFWRKTFKTVFQGFIIATIGVLIAYLLLPDNSFDVRNYCGGFARKWDGSCMGWTTSLATSFIIGSLLHWYAYTIISIMVWTRHPITRNNKYSAPTVILTGFFIFGCGVTHLLAAYTVLNPLYNAETYYLIFNGATSLLASFFVVYGLIRSSEVAKQFKIKLGNV